MFVDEKSLSINVWERLNEYLGMDYRKLKTGESSVEYFSIDIQGPLEVANNGAYALQQDGKLVPYVYHIQLDNTVIKK